MTYHIPVHDKIMPVLSVLLLAAATCYGQTLRPKATALESSPSASLDDEGASITFQLPGGVDVNARIEHRRPVAKVGQGVEFGTDLPKLVHHHPSVGLAHHLIHVWYLLSRDQTGVT